MPSQIPNGKGALYEVASSIVPLGSIGCLPVHTYWGKWHATNQCRVFWGCAMASLQIAYID